ncbi:anthocyanidin-3-O-glucoside rhamnosyltransferase [Ricinus communis]|uniref:Glycosyltransferase n=1 Tax=Ricinus communis TaxID=3988 RepID=B9RBG2_RICCO|nr:anthocyanidin-3-O-glucoside rhamnosyltransferase [Ricinus communis]XP_048229487.1 anthocyanidin-3-O-glucoside rhamnosyltransferase [Ricinus communis]EEF50883.1 UDP-glucosyltransferase, putative [Ricinus communis]|eukprot:XP_025012114.1 anthocyanidin 3-O-glucosyltransferase [Ricinus communis]
MSTCTRIPSQIHIVMFPWLAFGHINPFVQLCNKLSLHGIEVSFLSASGNIPRIKSSLLPTPNSRIIPISIPPVAGLPQGLDNTSEMTPAMADLFKKAIDLMQPQIKTLLSQLKPHFILFDFLIQWIPEIASELGIKTIGFSVFSAISGAYIMVPARSTATNVDDLMKPPTGFPSSPLISMKEFQAQNISYVFKHFDNGPSVFDRVTEGHHKCDAIVFKTCNEMEGPYINFLLNQFQKRVLLAGPLVPEPTSGLLEEKWDKWLGQFPPKSVILCSFGSETFLQDDQIKELALGLELTGLPFILIMNFSVGVDAYDEINRTLPEGFLERTKDRGIVHTGWVQQQLLLAHKSVGCYLCHSGFSSLIEAVINDCQLVLLPLKGDQCLNSKLFSECMKAGVEVNRRNEDGYFGKEDIDKAVRRVMVEVEKEPSKSIRANHKKWREFLLNEEIQDKFIAELVKEIKALA